jgi:hypothetical protein
MAFSLGSQRPQEDQLSKVFLSRLAHRFRFTFVFISAQTTSQTKTTILTHIFALCLRVDDYATDTTLVAADLAMPLAKYATLHVSIQD